MTHSREIRAYLTNAFLSGMQQKCLVQEQGVHNSSICLSPLLFFILDVKLVCPRVIKQNTDMARMGVPTALPQGLQSESGGLYVQNNT